MKKVLYIVLACLVMGSLFGCKKHANRLPTEDEVSMLVTIDALADYGYTNMPREACESWSAKLSLDGTSNVEYEFDSELAPDSEFIFLSSSVNLSKSEADAQKSFKIAVGAIELVIRMFGSAEIEKKPDLIELGDESYSALVTAEDNPVGNLVVIRDGQIIHTLVVMGIYFDQQDLLEDLFITPLVNATPDKFGLKE